MCCQAPGKPHTSNSKIKPPLELQVYSFAPYSHSDASEDQCKSLPNNVCTSSFTVHSSILHMVESMWSFFFYWDTEYMHWNEKKNICTEWRIVMKKTALKPSPLLRNRTTPVLHVTNGDSSSWSYSSFSQNDIILAFVIIMSVPDVYSLISMS